mgnify:CR=1 FL=1
MVYDKVIEGKYVNLRSVNIEDADYTLSLRQDPELTKYLPKLDISLAQQKKWIEKQRSKPGDYYFIIQDKEGANIGVIGVYDVQGCQCETGRIAVKNGNSFQSLEAQLLTFDFAFDVLNLSKTVNYVYADNVHAIRLSQMFGAEVTNKFKDETGMIRVDHVISVERYKESRKKLARILYR